MLSKFHWCVFTPFEGDASGRTYRLRFATMGKADLWFFMNEVDCHDVLVVQVVEAAYDVV